MEGTGCRIVKYGKKDAEFHIYDIADIHLMNRGVSKPTLNRDIELIRSYPYALWFEGGDYADWIYPGDPRFDPMAFDIDIRVVDLSRLAALISKMVIRTFMPIKNKGLGMCIGNHEFTAITRRSEVYVHEEICMRLGIPNMRFSGWADIYFVYEPGFRGMKVTASDRPPGKFVSRLRCFIHHGMGAPNTAGGKINKLKQLVDMVEADLVMMGHVHEQFAKAFLRLEPDKNCLEVGQKITMGLITGSYLRTYAPDFTGYGEVRGYQPATLGATRARYIPSTRTLTVENRADNVGMKGNQ